MTLSIFYLHGFASSPQSNKAQEFARRFAAKGIQLRIPDLNVPSFEQLTLTAMLEKVAQEVDACPPGDVYLMGSSMGGAVALHFCDRYRGTQASRVRKLFLMAPAFDFAANRWRDLGEAGINAWRETGSHPFFNYAAGGIRPVHYGLFEDLQGYESYGLQLELPMLIFHGQRDESVEVEQSIRFASTRPNVDLRVVDSDHQLLDQTDGMWAAAQTFFAV
jgi:pimeloyl-ACP methyl ester carboxylesterase